MAPLPLLPNIQPTRPTKTSNANNVAELFSVIETFPSQSQAFALIYCLVGESYQINYVRGTVPMTPKLLMNGPAMAGFLIMAP